MRTSISFAVRAIRAANSWAYSVQNTAQLRQSLREFLETSTTLLSQCYAESATDTHSRLNLHHSTRYRRNSLPSPDFAFSSAVPQSTFAFSRRRKPDSPSVGFTGWSLFMAVWMLLKEAGGPHCCSTPMALQNWSASCRHQLTLR